MTMTAPLSLVTVGGSGLDGMPARRGGGEEEGERDYIEGYHNTHYVHWIIQVCKQTLHNVNILISYQTPNEEANMKQQ